MRALVLTPLIFAAACNADSASSSAEARAPEPVGGEPYEVGIASYYSDALAGRPTASGEPYDPALPTCAHKKLKLGTEVEVIRLSNRRRARCRVNDRGPFHEQRIIDLSRSVAEELEIDGIAQVEIRKVPK